MQEDRDADGRAELERVLTGWDRPQVTHPGAEFSWSAEYRRVMTDPRSTPEQRAAARERELRRQAAVRDGHRQVAV